ncbi:MAG: flagellar basal body L-ring protein FlgH [Hyphomicrobiales bacterium]
MARPLFAASCLVLLAACGTDIRDIGRQPHMTPVGSGLQVYTPPNTGSVFPASIPSGRQSLFDNSRANLFSDLRASRVGDTLTVTISMDEKATLGNTTDRTQDSKVSTGFDFLFGWKTKSTKGSGNFDANSTSTSNGQGSIDRSEKIQLKVAAVVTDVLPNGNLIISGSQEVRVNFELRLLNVAGIVRPDDVSRANTIPYEKIAEARISYGGRGRLTEVQQPAWGQQTYDAFRPF